MASQAIPHRQIRAQYTSTTITVYQAYNKDIAQAAVIQQKLNASPKFSTTRMTWIKPSWTWMLYRSGYSYKDPGQECILALTLTRPVFLSLLRKAVVSSHDTHAADSGVMARKEGGSQPVSVRVQWDPERTFWLEKLPHRSIQIGVPGALIEELVDGIVKIEDVTSRARELKGVLDDRGDVVLADLDDMGLVPDEKAFEVDEELRKILSMDKSVCDCDAYRPS